MVNLMKLIWCCKYCYVFLMNLIIWKGENSTFDRALTAPSVVQELIIKLLQLISEKKL